METAANGAFAAIQANPMMYLVLAGVGVGALCVWFGITSAVSAGDGGARRMKQLRGRDLSAAATVEKTPRVQLVKQQDKTPSGMLKSFIPEDKADEMSVRQKLTLIGYPGFEAVRRFYTVRLTIALVLPISIFMLLAAQKLLVLPEALDAFVVGLSPLRIMQLCMGSLALGYYVPGYWLNSQLKARIGRIEAAFPNALDLMQISVEAGLAFDAAMSRVGRELAQISPEIAAEFLQVQTEIAAGRDRDLAMRDMASRMAIDEARSFANVVGQSLQFGTSLSEALRGYATEMRVTRELRAQEKANKLPVQMSAVMATLMLPALFLITLSPIVIRYMAVFGGD